MDKNHKRRVQLKLAQLKNFFDKRDIIGLVRVLTFMIVASILELLSVVTIGPLFGLLLSQEQYYAVSDEFKIGRLEYLVAYIGLLMVSFSSSLVTMKSLANYSANFGMKLSDKFFTSYIKNTRSALMLSKSFILKQVTTETQRFTGQIVIPSLQALSKLFTVIFLVGLLFVLNPIITLFIFLVIIGTYGGLVNIIGPRVTHNGFQESEATEQRLRVFNTFLEARVYSYIYVTRDKIHSALKIHSNTYARAQSSNLFLTQVPRFSIEMIIFIGMPVSIYLIQPSATEASKISIYLFSLFKLLPGLQQIYYSYLTFKANKASFVLLNDEVIEPEDYGFNTCEFTSSLKVNHLKYDGLSQRINSGISFEIRPGQKLIIKGPSGYGKTSLLKVILGLNIENSGEIQFDRISKNANSRLNYARSNMAYLEQFPVFYDASLRETLGIKHQSDLERAKVLLARLSLIEIFEKFCTNLGEEINFEKLNLSGGELQRLALCRALMSESDIFLLDEPFSALDNASIEMVHRLICESSRTFIIVSHIDIDHKDVFTVLDFKNFVS